MLVLGGAKAEAQITESDPTGTAASAAGLSVIRRDMQSHMDDLSSAFGDGTNYQLNCYSPCGLGCYSVCP